MHKIFAAVSIVFTVNAHASHWKADICRTFFLGARATPYEYVSVGGAGGVVYDHTYEGETSIAQFFADYDAATKEGARQNAVALRAADWSPAEVSSAFGRRMFDNFLWIAAYVNSFELLVALQLTIDQDRLVHPYWAAGTLAIAGAAGAFDFPYRYARSITLGRVKWYLASRNFRLGRSQYFSWTYHARVSETFARRLAEFHELGPRDVFGENVRSVTAGIWRSFLAPESTRHRFVTVRVTGNRRVNPPTLDVKIQVGRAKPVD